MKQFVDSQGITVTQYQKPVTVLVDQHVRSHKIQELTPFTTYSVNVSAIPQDHQYRPPTNIKVTTQMAGEFSLFLP